MKMHEAKQPLMFELAERAYASILLSGDRHGITNDEKLVAATLIQALGTIRWRRLLNPSGIARIYKLVGDVVTSDDEDRIEWIIPAYITFKHLMEEFGNPTTQVGTQIANVLAATSTCDLPEYQSLNLPVDQMERALSEHPVLIFLYCLYHSDIRSRIK